MLLDLVCIAALMAKLSIKALPLTARCLSRYLMYDLASLDAVNNHTILYCATRSSMYCCPDGQATISIEVLPLTYRCLLTL